MPNGRDHLKYEEFGKHGYAETGTSDCAYGCGCWMGPARSGGPAGVDPFGKCPNNPLKEVTSSYSRTLLNEKERLVDLINSRIAYLEKKVSDLEPYAALVQEAKKLSKIDLQKKLDVGRKLNFSLNNKINKIVEQLQNILSTMV